MKLLKYLLLGVPTLWYAIVVAVRNKLFDWGVLRSRSFRTPTIVVGNIAVGGTGKTPHVEYLVRLFGAEHTAVLSRGYRRTTRGFLMASETDDAITLGDEPLQIYCKFPQLCVAVDTDRVHGMEKLEMLRPDLQVVLLDDAFQHRYVRPTLNLALVDYNRPPWQDHLLPMGRLREPLRALHRADAVIVTKCPENLSQTAMDEWRKLLQLNPVQPLFGTTIRYMAARPLFPECCTMPDLSATKSYNILTVAGIATPDNFFQYVAKVAAKSETLRFADHHPFSMCDVQHMTDRLNALPEPNLLFTTEKDAARLRTMSLPPILKAKLGVVSVEVVIMWQQKAAFDAMVRARLASR